jgi:hypothetical protein
LAAQQERLRQEIEGAEARVEQQREAERTESEQRAAQEKYNAEQAESQRQQALLQRQADDAERVRIAQLEFQANASNEERAIVDHLQKWDAWAKKTPEMMSYSALNHTKQTNPQRWAAIEKEALRAQQAFQVGQKRLAELNEARQLRQHAVAMQQQEAAQAAYQQISVQEDAKAHEAISKELPAYKTEAGRKAISEASRNLLKSVGLNDQHIRQVWSEGQPVYLRSAAAQQILAMAAAYRLAAARAREAQKAPVPQALKPGMARPRGAGGAELVRSLERQLAGETGNQALKTSVKLAQARRAL